MIKKIKDEVKEDNEKLINIESLLFGLVSKTNNFENIFTIYLSQKFIDKYNSKDYYKKAFNKFNDSNIKYISLSYLNNIN